MTFTDPEVGAVGLTEKQARDKGINVRVGIGRDPGRAVAAGSTPPATRASSSSSSTTIAASSSARPAPGPTGGETLSALAFAVRAEIPVATLKNTIYAYPTFYRAIETALSGR